MAILEPTGSNGEARRTATMFRNTVIGLLITNVVLMLAVVIGGSLVGGAIDRNGNRNADRLYCAVSELSGPWVAFRETLRAPAGDPAARAHAVEVLDAALARLERIDNRCS